MASPHKDEKAEKPRRQPARTPEQQESYLVSLALDHVERQLIDGTLSSQVLTHILKLGSEKEKLERQKLSGEVVLLDAKAESYTAAKSQGELYENTIKAMREYQTGEEQEDYE